MSFGGGAGAAGNKRVIIEFIGDDTKLTQVLARSQRSLQTFGQTGASSVKQVGTAMQSTTTQTNAFTGALAGLETNTKSTSTATGALANNFKTLETSTKGVSGGLDKTNTLAGKTVDSMDDLGKSGGKAQSKMDKLKETFAGNRGLVYSGGLMVGTITGIVTEFQLMEDASKQVADSQAALNDLTEQGITSGTEYSRAQDALAKDQRFLQFSTRNLANAMFNLVPEVLLVATSLTKVEGIGGKLGGVFGKLKGVMGGGGSGIAGTLAGIGTGAAGASTGVKTLTGAFVALGKVIGVVAGFEVLGRAWADLLKQGNPAIKAVHDFGTELEKLPIIGPALKAFGDIMNTIFLPDLVAKEKEQAEALAKAVQDLGISYYNAYDPTSSFSELVNRQKSIWKNGAQTTVDYTKNINMLGVEMQNSATTSKIATLGFKQTSGSLTKVSDSTAVVTSDFQQFMNRAAVPANKVIAALSKEVQSGAISQDMLGDAVEQTIAPMLESKEVTETNKDMVAQLATEHLTALIPGLKQETETEKALNKIAEENLQLNQAAAAMLRERAKEVADLVEVENNLAKVGVTRNDITSRDNELNTALNQVVVQVTDAYKEEEDSLAKVLLTHGKLNRELALGIGNNVDNTEAMRDAIIQSNLWTDALDGVVNGVDLVKKGTADAVIEMDAFVQSAVTNAAKTKALDQMYAALGKTMVGTLHTTIPLTTKDLTALGKSFGDGVPLAEKLADIVEKDLAPAFQTFSQVIGATDKKGFREAFKDLSLKGVGKKFKGELKDILEGMNKIAKGGKEMATVVSGVVIGALQGMSKKGLGQGINEIVKGFDKFKKLDPDASIVQPLINFVDNLPPESRAQGLLLVHQGLEDITEAQSKGNITTEKAKEILGKYQPMIDKYNAAIAAGKSPAEAMAEATNAVGTGLAEVGAGAGPAYTAIDSVIKRMQDLPEVVKGLEEPKIEVNIQDAIKSMDVVVRRLGDIAKIKTIPKIDVNIEKFIKGADTVVKRLQSINKMTAVPKINVNIEKALKGMDTVVRRLQDINKMHADPKINVTKTETTIKKTVTQGPHIAGGLDSHINGRDNGHITIVINNTDEFGMAKQKKFKASLGRAMYRFG